MPPGTHTSAVIVLLTDGENNEQPDPLAAAQTRGRRGIQIDTVGIGSPGGATLDIDGFQVHTQLNEALLKQIAQHDRPARTTTRRRRRTSQRSTSELGRSWSCSREPVEITALFAARLGCSRCSSTRRRCSSLALACGRLP